jgi:F420-dependent oxidoreductase-like protein
MIFSIGGSSGVNWKDLLEVTRAAEELGFYGFYPSDHLMQVQQRGPSAARLDAPTMLACLAGYTRTLRLGPLVLGNLFRHPVITAKMFSTIDQATNGRVELGIGASWSPEEHQAHGFPYPPFKERLARLDEALQIITGLWTQERTTVEGKYYQVHDVPFEPKPVQKPHPPIIVGGSNPGTLRIAAHYADEWNILGAPRLVAQDIERMKTVCAEQGRDFGTLRVSHQMALLITDSKEEADRFVKQHMDAAAASPNFKLSPLYGSAEEQVRDNILAGDAETVKDAVRRWQELGVTHLNFLTPRPFNRAVLERFSAQVMPAFT